MLEIVPQLFYAQNETKTGRKWQFLDNFVYLCLSYRSDGNEGVEMAKIPSGTFQNK